jgi:hypothetical protein
MRRLSVAPFIALVAVVGCRNTIVEDVRVDAGPDVGEGEGEEGEGEGEDPCDANPPAVSVRVADGDGFVSCEAGSVALTVNGTRSVAEVVPVEDDGCRHQGGFGVPGRYTVDVTVAGFQPEQSVVDVPADACNDPITTTVNVRIDP